MDPEARRRLKESIKKVGLLAPITWNGRSGNIVGGHQRIKALDAVHGSEDYTLRVAKVDLDDAAEKAANIALNSPTMQGDWDLDLLAPLLKDESLDIIAAGLDATNVLEIIGVDDAPDPVVVDLANKAREAVTKAKASNANAVESRNTDFYAVFVWKSRAARNEFLVRVGLQDDFRYHDGSMLDRLVPDGVKLQPDADTPDPGTKTPKPKGKSNTVAVDPLSVEKS